MRTSSTRFGPAGDITTLVLHWEEGDGDSKVEPTIDHFEGLRDLPKLKRLSGVPLQLAEKVVAALPPDIFDKLEEFGLVADFGGQMYNRTNWLHSTMTDKGAADLLVKSLGSIVGGFLVRHTASPEPKEFVLTVSDGELVSHHLISLLDKGFAIDGHDTGTSTITECVEKLRSIQPYWSVPLSKHVPGQLTNKGGDSIGSHVQTGATWADKVTAIGVRGQNLEVERLNGTVRL